MLDTISYIYNICKENKPLKLFFSPQNVLLHQCSIKKKTFSAILHYGIIEKHGLHKVCLQPLSKGPKGQESWCDLESDLSFNLLSLSYILNIFNKPVSSLSILQGLDELEKLGFCKILFSFQYDDCFDMTTERSESSITPRYLN